MDFPPAVQDFLEPTLMSQESCFPPAVQEIKFWILFFPPLRCRTDFLLIPLFTESRFLCFLVPSFSLKVKILFVFSSCGAGLSWTRFDGAGNLSFPPAVQEIVGQKSLVFPLRCRT